MVNTLSHSELLTIIQNLDTATVHWHRDHSCFLADLLFHYTDHTGQE